VKKVNEVIELTNQKDELKKRKENVKGIGTVVGHK